MHNFLAKTCALTGIILMLGLPAPAFPDAYKDGIQCVSAIQTVTNAWPADNPGKIKADETAELWRAYSQTLSEASDETIAADVDTGKADLTAAIISFKGDQAAMTGYMNAIMQRCSVAPPVVEAPSTCIAVAGAEQKSADFALNMHQYNLSLQSGAEALATRAEIAKDEKKMADAQRILDRYAGAQDAPTEKLLELMQMEAEGRMAIFNRCLSQIEE